MNAEFYEEIGSKSKVQLPKWKMRLNKIYACS